MAGHGSPRHSSPVTATRRLARRLVDGLPAVLRPSSVSASQLSALFSDSAESWLLLDVGSDWLPGHVSTVVAAVRGRYWRHELAGFRILYHERNNPSVVVIISEQLAASDTSSDAASKIAEIERILKELTRELRPDVAAAVPDVSQLPPESRQVAGRPAIVRVFASPHHPALATSVIERDGVMAVIAAYQADLGHLLDRLIEQRRPQVSPEGIILLRTQG